MTGNADETKNGTWIPFEVTPTGATEVSIETESDATKKSTLTFTLTGNTYAIIDSSKAKSNAAELALDGTGVKDGQLTFKAASALTKGTKYSTNLLVVPTNSYYARIIKGSPDQPTTPAATNAEDSTTPGMTPTTPSVPTKTDLIKL